MRFRTIPPKLSEKSAGKAPGSSVRSPSSRPFFPLGCGHGPEHEYVDHYDEGSRLREQDEVPPSDMNSNISSVNEEITDPEEFDGNDHGALYEDSSDNTTTSFLRDLQLALTHANTDHTSKKSGFPCFYDDLSNEFKMRSSRSLETVTNGSVETVSLEDDVEVHVQDQRPDLMNVKLTDTDNEEYKHVSSSMAPGQFIDLKAHYKEHNLKSTFVPGSSGWICDGPGRPPPRDGQAPAFSRGREERECNGGSFDLRRQVDSMTATSRSSADLRRRIANVRAKSKNFDKGRIKAVNDYLENGELTQDLTSALQDCVGVNVTDVVITSPDQFALGNVVPVIQQLMAQSDSMARAQDLQAKENARIMSSIGFLTSSIGADEDLADLDSTD